MFGQRVAPGIMVFALGTGLGVPADATTILANYGTDRLRYTAPTWIDDTIYLDIEVHREVRQGREVRTGDVPLGHPQPERRHRLREPAQDPHRQGARRVCRNLTATYRPADHRRRCRGARAQPPGQDECDELGDGARASARASTPSSRPVRERCWSAARAVRSAAAATLPTRIRSTRMARRSCATSSIR